MRHNQRAVGKGCDNDKRGMKLANVHRPEGDGGNDQRLNHADCFNGALAHLPGEQQHHDCNDRLHKHRHPLHNR
ncbi:hypothetical protein D3C85_1889560 [compost metagenome]